MYKINTLKAMLRDGKVPVGVRVTLDSSSAAEAMAHAGFDFLMLDMEHNATDPETMHQMIQATRGTKTAPLVRVPWNEQWMIKFALDIGAYGVMVPQVCTREEALAVVRACRYAPEGERGVGPSYAALRWGMTEAEYVDAANREVAVVIQIETPQGVDNADEIVSVPGIDLMLFGPLDLAMAMGGLDLMGGAQHSAALRKVHEACNLAGVPVGMPATTREAIREALGEGYNAILVGSDLSLLLSGAEHILTCACEESGQSSRLRKEGGGRNKAMSNVLP